MTSPETQKRGLLFIEFASRGARAAKTGPDYLSRHQVVMVGLAKKRGGVIAGGEGERTQLVFAGPQQALACALALLLRFEEYNRACEDPAEKVSLRQVVHKASFRLQDDGVPPEQAEVAARLLDVAPPGRIYCTRAAYAPSLGAAPCEFIPLGWEHFPGLRAPVDVFEVVPAPEREGAA